MLIASTSGNVDIAGDKGIHLYSGEELHIEALEEATIQSQNLVLTGEAGGRKGVIAINREEKEPKIEVEMGECKIILDDVIGIKASSGASLLELNVHPPEKPKDKIGTIKIENRNAGDPGKPQTTEIMLENETCLIRLDSDDKILGLGVRQKKNSKPLAEIVMNLSEKSIAINADKTIEIKAPTVNVGPDAEKMTIGNSKTDVTFFGKKGSWKAAKINIG